MPPPLVPLVLHAEARLAQLGAGVATQWLYERCTDPPEALLHVTGSERGTCAHVARAHASRHVMVSLDLYNGLAWQRCWDPQCIVAHGRAYTKARHALGHVPEDALERWRRTSMARA